MNRVCNNPARQGQLGVSEDMAIDLRSTLVDELERLETADAILGEILDDDGVPIGITLEVVADPADRERVAELARAADFSVVEVESRRSLDHSRPGRVAYTADEVRLTLGVFIDV